ncbi:hypothetical protein MMH89_01455 [Candidatus Comchoanobacter bicostacola]|uniref:Type IV / VI secretion system DotU domain-containing protein n=1 Tax=Candidatus Comchoanobacter bicostacola TaxID=2919598 RepID=A0ABY5DLI4_9GAMM|nr:hypothetical protein [Candidatus Comchoanobacter bicostacola]UTC24818.1 hypothetical protein MMH89_01455 [Candidatus Comchoanobacter bicostacola]
MSKYINQLIPTLSNITIIELTIYDSICQLLACPTIETLQYLIIELDAQIDLYHSFTTQQNECLKYLFRDWGYMHLKEKVDFTTQSKLFTINNTLQNPGHFLKAIDFAKRNPKDNQELMKLSLMLMTQAKLADDKKNPKIEALMQLLSSVDKKKQPPSSAFQLYKNHIISLCIANLFLLLSIIYCITL